MSQKEISPPNDNTNDSSNGISIVKNPVIFLLAIGVIGFFIRMYYFPYEIPIAQDGIFYFLYALELSFQGQFPEFNIANNGWPTFISIFFSIFHTADPINYIYIQRILSISISILTIIPVYFLCTRFVNRSFALIGAAIFAFEPRIIQNSLLGLTEPLYIILLSIGLFLFFSEKSKLVYTSFGVFALFSLVRFEGLLIIIPISIMFFAKYRKSNKVILRYLIAISIFILVLSPMAYIRTETIGDDGLITHLYGGPDYISNIIIEGKKGYGPENTFVGNEPHERFFSMMKIGLESLIMYLGWVMIPVFIFFMPYGIFKIFKNRSFNEVTIILVTITMLIPVLYAYGRGIQDTRFLYGIFPILCIACTFSIERFASIFQNKRNILIVFVVGILFSSVIFLEYTKIDYDRERETFSTANFVVSNTDGINESSGVKYMRFAEIQEKWPDLPPHNDRDRPTYDLQILSTKNYDNIEKFIKDNKMNLTHLVIDRVDQQSFLYDVLDNEEKYPYLIKVFDSSDYDYKFPVNIYKINYEKFNDLQKNKF